MKKLSIKKEARQDYYSVPMMRAIDVVQDEVKEIRKKMKKDGYDQEADQVFLKLRKDMEDFRKYIISLQHKG